MLKIFLDLPLMLLGYLVIPIALKYEQDNHLPWWAEWCWGNKDHGNDGEGFWAPRTVGWSRFSRCFWWLVVRNPTFNWSKYIIGYRSNGLQRVIEATARPDDIGDKKGPGFYYIREGWVWDIYWIKPYSKNRCIRFRCGWKIEGKDAGEVAQFVFAPNPFHPYSGR